MDLYVLKMHKVFFFSTRNVLINALRISYNVFDLTHTHSSSSYIYLVLTTHPTQPSVCLSLPLSSPIKSNFYCSDPVEYGACPESDLQWSHSFRKLILPFSVFSNCFLFKNPLCNCFCLKAELEMTSLVLFSTFLWFYFFCDLFTRLILILFSHTKRVRVIHPQNSARCCASSRTILPP